ncbi:unnamed protein product [Ilex paraguariensis]|uniref:Uncharacterized protein n=1 Tax=Ilex paraguariensis TaxID=185542 RepID=A0ABC8RNI5_9AQUA
MIRYRRLTHFDVDTFVEEVLVKGSTLKCHHIWIKYQWRCHWALIREYFLVHWYGYVMPDDVSVLLEQHIGKGEIVDLLWRGQMGLSEEDQKKSQELRLQQNGGATMEGSTKNMTQANEMSTTICGSQVEGMSCCQAN